jgi:hypothetical protein
MNGGLPCVAGLVVLVALLLVAVIGTATIPHRFHGAPQLVVRPVGAAGFEPATSRV